MAVISSQLRLKRTIRAFNLLLQKMTHEMQSKKEGFSMANLA
jgi:hypothetical protein